MTLAIGDVTVTGRIEHATLELRPGEITAICGPNGAGKSTLLAVLAGLLTPDWGTATLDGRPLAAVPARLRAQSIGYLQGSISCYKRISIPVATWPEPHLDDWIVFIHRIRELGF